MSLSGLLHTDVSYSLADEEEQVEGWLRRVGRGENAMVLRLEREALGNSSGRRGYYTFAKSNSKILKCTYGITLLEVMDLLHQIEMPMSKGQ